MLDISVVVDNGQHILTFMSDFNKRFLLSQKTMLFTIFFNYYFIIKKFTSIYSILQVVFIKYIYIVMQV